MLTVIRLKHVDVSFLTVEYLIFFSSQHFHCLYTFHIFIFWFHIVYFVKTCLISFYFFKYMKPFPIFTLFHFHHISYRFCVYCNKRHISHGFKYFYYKFVFCILSTLWALFLIQFFLLYPFQISVYTLNPFVHLSNIKLLFKL